MIAFLKNCPKNTQFHFKACTKLVLQKGIGARKANVKVAAVDLICEIYDFIPDSAKPDFFSVLTTQIKARNFK